MYYIGRSLAETPQHIILLSFQGFSTYFMYGLQLSDIYDHGFFVVLIFFELFECHLLFFNRMDVEKILIYNVLVILTGTAGAGLLLLCSAITKTFEQANLATFIILLLMLFDGMLISCTCTTLTLFQCLCFFNCVVLHLFNLLIQVTGYHWIKYLYITNGYVIYLTLVMVHKLYVLYVLLHDFFVSIL